MLEVFKEKMNASLNSLNASNTALFAYVHFSIGVCGFFGNALIIAVTAHWWHRASRRDRLIGFLAVCDLVSNLGMLQVGARRILQS